MGNCGTICNKTFKYKGDIIIDKLLIEQNNYNCISSYNLSQIIYLQKKIKYFLKRKKIHKSNHSSNKSTKQTGNKRRANLDKNTENNLMVQKHFHYNTRSKKSSSKSQNFKNSSLCKNSAITKSNKNGSSPKNKSPKNIIPKIKSPKNKTPKNNSSKNNKNVNLFPKKKTNNTSYKGYEEQNLIKEIEICKETAEEEPPDENGLLIQILKPTLLEKNVFEGDAFKIGNRNTKLENDPRDSKENNIRKKYPKITENQSSYTGEWMNGKRDGLGLLSLENEVKFLGYFVENKVDGYGHLWQEKGDSYKGEWKNFLAEGWGIYQTIEGAYFRGNWIGNKQNGFGVERWPRGSIFFGDYILGNKSGIGVLNFESKAWYEGEFKNGNISGIGSFFFEDGRRYQGMWKNNKMDGYGYIIWPDENFYEGEFKEDKKEGFGICRVGKKTFMGMWKDNKLYGNVLIIDDGKYKKQYWINGKASKSLPNETLIPFEKYAEKYIKKFKNKKK
jgi:hypothetical protein